jgi:hypothetical protein
MFRNVGIAFVAVIALASGCATQDGLDPGETPDTLDAKADGASTLRMGTYDVSFGTYYSMTLNLDGTYQLIGGCKQTGPGLHCFAITEDNGHYKLTKSGSHKYIRLYSDPNGGELVYRFSYKVSGTHRQTVSMTETHTGETSTATLENADKSQEGESCGGFVATANACAPDLVCQAAARCCDLPGTCVRQ